MERSRHTPCQEHIPDSKTDTHKSVMTTTSSCADTQEPVPTSSASSSCAAQILFLVLHGGNLLETNQDSEVRAQNLQKLKVMFSQIVQSGYCLSPAHIQFRLVACPNMAGETLSLLSSLSPYGITACIQRLGLHLARYENCAPLSAVAVCATGSTAYQQHIHTMVLSANQAYHHFLRSEDGRGFAGQVCLLADPVGSLLAYDALTRSSRPFTFCGSGESQGSLDSIPDSEYVTSVHNSKSESETMGDRSIINWPGSEPREAKPLINYKGNNSTPSESSRLPSNMTSSPPERDYESGPRPVSRCLDTPEKESTTRRSSEASVGEWNVAKFDFDVSEFFMCGAPLATVLAYRRFHKGQAAQAPQRPTCHQIYNIHYSTDPAATRLEPLIHPSFSYLPPVTVCRYQTCPLGDGEVLHVVETVQNHLKLFTSDKQGDEGCIKPDRAARLLQRQNSCNSCNSTASMSSGLGEATVTSITNVTRKWWGVKRLDYILSSSDLPPAVPTEALPRLFHSSFWESADLVAFILRQVLRQDEFRLEPRVYHPQSVPRHLLPKLPREKWLRRSTTTKVRNLRPNHRANDVIVLEDAAQVVTARFMYGSLDIACLSGEKVDVHMRTHPVTDQWTLLGTQTTDKRGRFSFSIPDEQRLELGVHQLKLVVRGDHTSVHLSLAVLPTRTQTVAFSIDGSFTASVSLTGSDPKVRAGAVSVVRHWQELGYLILYISARPDLQYRKVTSWLASHNFPHGCVAFMDGLSRDPIRQKLNYIRNLQSQTQIELAAAYGSSKDISLYRELGLQPDQIFILGKVSRRHLGQAQMLTEGYPAHFAQLTSPGLAPRAIVNSGHFLSQSSFRLPSYEVRGQSSDK